MNSGVPDFKTLPLTTALVFFPLYLLIWASQVVQWEGICLPTQEMWVRYLVKKIPWRKKWQPAPVFLSRKSHGQRSLGGYSLRALKRLGYDLVTKQLAHLPKNIRVEEQTGTRSIILPPNKGKDSQMCLRSFWALTLPGVPASMPPAMGCDVWGWYLCEQLLLLEKN